MGLIVRFLNEDEWKAVEKELSVWAFPDHPNVLGYADIYESKGRLQVRLPAPPAMTPSLCFGEYVSKGFPRFGGELGLRTPTLRCGYLSGPSRTRGGFFDCEVGGHGGAYKGRVHVIVPLSHCWAKKWDVI